MIKGNKVIVLPAYNAARTLQQTYFYAGYEIAEITCPTKYFDEASSINFSRSLIYGAGVLRVSVQYLPQKPGLGNYRIFRNVVRRERH